MHEIKRKVQQRQENRILPLTPVCTYLLFFLILCLLLVICTGPLLTTRLMKHSAQVAQRSVVAQISQRIDESLKLLNSLATLLEFHDPFVKWEEKVGKPDGIDTQLSYTFICYVDEDIQVYMLGEEPASSVTREHMQKLYATKQPTITDSFVADADDVTPNCMAAAPLFQDDVMTGSLFYSICLDDTVELLKEAASANQSGAAPTGSEGQVMSSANGLSYGPSYVGQLQDVRMHSVTTDALGTKLLACEPSVFYSRRDGSLMYTAYGPVKNTNWDIPITADLFCLLSAMLPHLLLIAVITVAVAPSLYLLARAYSRQQRANMENMVIAAHRMERKLCKNSIPEQVDYDDLLQTSGVELWDGLTGVVTRAVPLSRMQKLLESGEYGSCVALCFVDFDDLKTLNDTHGHQAGDNALREAGSILREYKMKYEGIFGRYGGDEFILVLNDTDTAQEVHVILSELVEKLNFSIVVRQKAMAVHCDIGACIWDRTDSLDVLTAKVDRALYGVKRHGKKTYSFFLKGES